MAFNYGIDFIYQKFNHLLKFENVNHEELERFAEVINRKGCPLNNCIGFIDGTLRPTCRPSSTQKPFYSGYKRCHGIKFQSIVYPNGIIANLAGPFHGNRHDSGMLAESGVVEFLEKELKGIGGRRLCLYGDQGYGIAPYLLRPYQGARLTPLEHQFNRAMSINRIVVEWSFGKIIQYFAFLDYKKNLKLLLQPVGKMYAVGAILTNCHTCLYGSETSIYFQCAPPKLESYLV